MRFRNLIGLIDLPIDAVEHRFRNEQVLTVLPVHGAMAGSDALLVATSTELAVLITDNRQPDRWTTYRVPWELVGLGALESEAGIHRIAIGVDSAVLSAELWGPEGEQALRDFVIAADAQHEALAAPA